MSKANRKNLEALADNDEAQFAGAEIGTERVDDVSKLRGRKKKKKKASRRYMGRLMRGAALDDL